MTPDPQLPPWPDKKNPLLAVPQQLSATARPFLYFISNFDNQKKRRSEAPRPVVAGKNVVNSTAPSESSRQLCSKGAFHPAAATS